jgi:uncharacterized lipoprotein NlpE involved in copper resistance
MKKLVVVLMALVLVFTLAGCNKEEVYTQKEVDDLILELRVELQEKYVQTYDDNKLYSGCITEDEQIVCQGISVATRDYVYDTQVYAVSLERRIIKLEDELK